MKKIICYAVNDKSGSGIPVQIGEWNDISDVIIRLEIFKKDTVLSFEEVYGGGEDDIA